MEFTVPQFIDQEDKIIGPVTVRQFLIMVVGSIIVAVEYSTLRFTTFIIVGLMTVLPFLTLAFVKINGRPFHYFLINTIERFRKPNVRVWNKDLTTAELKFYMKVKEEKIPVAALQSKRLTASQLTQLSLVVDTGGSYGGEEILDPSLWNVPQEELSDAAGDDSMKK